MLDARPVEAIVDHVDSARHRRRHSCRPYSVKSGTGLFFEGDSPTSLFEITDGVLRLSRVSISGQRHVIAFRFAGEFVGFPSDQGHLTDCCAITDATLLRIPTAALNAEMADPKLHRKLVAASLQEIEELQNHQMMLGHRCSREKLAAFLLNMASRLGKPRGRQIEFKLPMPRTDIADLLGLTIETVSRTLTELRHAGLIKIQNIHRIILLDPLRLACVAEGEC